MSATMEWEASSTASTPVEQELCSSTTTSVTSASREENEFYLLDQSTKRSRNWAFTTTMPNVKQKRDFPNYTAHVFTGPLENSTNAPGTAHGIIMYKSTKENKQSSPLSKKQVAEHLSLMGIPLYNDYIASVKTIGSYVKYMYKTTAVPKELMDVLPVKNSSSSDYKHEIVQELYGKFETKPNYNQWKKAVIQELGISVAEQIVSRSYKQWPTVVSKRFKNLKKNLKKFQRKSVDVEELRNWIERIMKESFDSIMYEGVTISQEEFLILVVTAAMEARAGEIEYAPHFMFFGGAGTGKSLFVRTFFGEEVSSGMPNDAEGVGCLEMDTEKVVFRVDDAGAKLWENTGVMASIKEMYHASWSAKIHSTKQVNDPTCCVITTNHPNPKLELGKVDNAEAWDRRMCYIKTGEKKIDLGPIS